MFTIIVPTYLRLRFDPKIRHKSEGLKLQGYERNVIITGGGNACWNITVYDNKWVHAAVTLAAQPHVWYRWKYNMTMKLTVMQWTIFMIEM